MNKTLRDHIPLDEVELLPLHLVLAEETPAPDKATRLGVSDTHRAEGYICETFYKPISRCVER